MSKKNMNEDLNISQAALPMTIAQMTDDKETVTPVTHFYIIYINIINNINYVKKFSL